MSSNLNIQIIPSHKLDKAKWDNCIYTSHNGLIYATSLYLDTMATQWDAMVLNEYEFVMPLPWRKKWFINYIYPPAFIQQLGIFSAGDITAEKISLFVKNIPTRFKLCVIPFNYANNINVSGISVKKNYLLDMSGGYIALQKAYSRSAKRNILKARSNGVTITENIDPAEIISLHRQRFNDNIGATKNDYAQFGILAAALLKKGECFTAGAYNSQRNLVAGSIYFLFKNRLTFILNGNSEESLGYGATHLLKDHVIRKFAPSGAMLDFEGSDFPQFARFYEQFGATEAEHYPTLTINRLPFLLNLLKR